MHEHWTDEEREALKATSTFEGTAEVAIAILVRMKGLGHPIVQICGPMSTGGLGNLERNMIRFQQAIDIATERGLTVFNQIPFQEAIIRICKFEEGPREYDWDILEIFYRRIFESGHISKTLFLSDWQSSTGATWERNLVTRLGIPTEEYPPEWLNGHA